MLLLLRINTAVLVNRLHIRMLHSAVDLFDIRPISFEKGRNRNI